MLSNLKALVAFVALVNCAAAVPESPCKPLTICIDGINDCGEGWGGCYDTCSPQSKPTKPPCASTSQPPPTITTFSTRTTKSGGCDPVTLCEDFIDACGQPYGGCYNTCKPKPTWVKPSCSLTGGSTSSCVPATLCVDYIDACGQMYGGCYNTCSPKPTFKKPSCSITTTAGNTATITDHATTSSCPTICVDKVDRCGQKYGGCYDSCKPPPPYAQPPCSITEDVTVTTTVGPTGCDPMTICEDWIDPCGQTYGGCYDTCGPRPTWTAPPCSATEQPTDVCYG